MFFFKECMICLGSEMEYFDELSLTEENKLWYDHLKKLRNQPGYNLLPVNAPLSMPKRLSDKILFFNIPL